MDGSNPFYQGPEVSEDVSLTEEDWAHIPEGVIRRLFLLATSQMFSTHGPGIRSGPPIGSRPFPDTVQAVISDHPVVEDVSDEEPFCNDASCPCNSIDHSPDLQEAGRAPIFEDSLMSEIDDELCADHACMFEGESESSGDIEMAEDSCDFFVDDDIYIDTDGTEVGIDQPGLSDLTYDFENMVCSDE
ncbi:hypothetical protein CORC01_01692 [Colletotrichum orchidophilum]|uniref:Uncharacterized protein n=1 Tax=Colletotrichum orchidophilum TaxID=1209926 RepID=A0A1G4BNE7_9PEZI|nr:uncharacterized protein CORC01_01692 [Colletotrichum orchidophilum]OHF02934.1 hypothetical protein CORC01_01692 [Colletotrichum orchidophilum]